MFVGREISDQSKGNLVMTHRPKTRQNNKNMYKNLLVYSSQQWPSEEDRKNSDLFLSN